MLKVRKFSGDLVPFEPEKLLKSLVKSGASVNEAKRVCERVIKFVEEGTSTKFIYKLAHGELKKMSSANATRYNLKQGILDLGPTGYTFEQYIAKLFTQMGYKTQTNLIVKGACVTHEIDVLLVDNSRNGFIECKFSNRDTAKIDVKIPLYVKSRWDDIRHCSLVDNSSKKFENTSCWIVSNQRFSSDAKAYANCTGMHWLGWDNNPENALAHWIDKFNVYPITSLNVLTKAEIKNALEANIICIHDIQPNWFFFEKMGLSTTRLKKIEIEVNELLKV